jgi:hypothetical protein
MRVLFVKKWIEPIKWLALCEKEKDTGLIPDILILKRLVPRDRLENSRPLKHHLTSRNLIVNPLSSQYNLCRILCSGLEVKSQGY